MKKALLTAILVFSAWGTMKAQLYVDGDINKDGIVNIADVAQLANKIITETPKSPEALIAGIWQTQDGEVLTLNEDGTTDYEGASTFKYKANEKYIYMYDSEGSIAHLFSVETISSAYMVLKQLGQNESKLYYNEFLMQHPFVQVVHDTIEVRNNYFPTTGDKLEAIDLGLPSGKLWANMNVGANSPEEIGYYYAYGEEYRKSTYTSTNYIGNITNIVLAKKTHGDEWYTPSKTDFEELINYCEKEVVTINDVKGILFTGYNGNSIFFPYNGYRIGDYLYSDDDSYYASSTLSGDYIYCLVHSQMSIGYTSGYIRNYYYPSFGYNYRAIRNKPEQSE